MEPVRSLRSETLKFDSASSEFGRNATRYPRRADGTARESVRGALPAALRINSGRCRQVAGRNARDTPTKQDARGTQRAIRGQECPPYTRAGRNARATRPGR